ncbi:hypothetical protein [Leisingera caerulea]|uniref:hypothetical protein n=1 Tax=Leisingera caerulea TaxID=506591 RepID=UPI0012B67277|nr:hypothetical protein [Leisingera caerulea]
MKKYTLSLFLLLFLLPGAACKDESRYTDEVVKGVVGKRDYFIPKSYFNKSVPPFTDNKIHLRTYFPSFLPRDEQERINKETPWWTNLSILASEVQNGSIEFNASALKSVEYLDASHFVENFFGLEHYRQPNGTNQDRYDVWYEKSEDGQIISYLTCSEKLADISVPQCTHYYRHHDIQIQLNYDRRLLPSWREIKANVLAVFDSFSSREAATQFIQDRISLTAIKRDQE